jgi:hypothetical protein
MANKRLSPENNNFIYIGARPFFRIVPKHPSLPESMTQEKGQRIARHQHKDFELVFDTSPRFREKDGLPEYSRYTSSTASLLGVEWSATDSTSPVPEADGMLTFEFLVHDLDCLKLLCDRRDPRYSHTHALQNRTVHWGLQDWGGLTLEIRRNDTQLYRCDVDVFAPEDTEQLSHIVYVFAISMDPVKFSDSRREDIQHVVLEPSTDSPPTGFGTLLKKYLLAPILWAFRGLRKSPEPMDRPLGNDINVGKCLKCGSNLMLEEAYVKLSEHQPTVALVPCAGCGEAAMVKFLTADERKRKGYFAEVLR